MLDKDTNKKRKTLPTSWRATTYLSINKDTKKAQPTSVVRFSEIKIFFGIYKQGHAKTRNLI